MELFPLTFSFKKPPLTSNQIGLELHHGNSSDSSVSSVTDTELVRPVKRSLRSS